jgi:predicted Zn-dependent protease
MPAIQSVPTAPPPIHAFFERTPMRTLIDVPGALLDQAMGLAYQAYRAGRYEQAETLCKGLLAADHRYWWAYSLYAAVLRKRRRFAEALAQIELGLRYEPGQPKLVQMKNELLDLARRVKTLREKNALSGFVTAEVANGN